MSHTHPSKIVVFNWKLNPTSPHDARSLFEGVKKASSRLKETLSVVCPPAAFLEALARGYRGKRCAFGAQDGFYEDSGAWTGEISLFLLSELGARYAIINHSERKKLSESRDVALKKLEAALRVSLVVVLCIGERERSASGQHLADVEEEILFFLSKLSPDQRSRVIIAYEPIWAIGKKGSEAATPHDLHEMALYIRKVLLSHFGRHSAYTIPLLYGGSVDETNAALLMETGEIRGFLVGRASLDVDAASKLLSVVEKAHVAIQNA